MRRLLLLCVIALLAGCTTMADQLHGSLKPPPGQGYAIFSMTVRTFTPDSASADLNWRGLDNSRHGTVWASFNTDTVFGEEGMSPAEGKLQLVALPPGRYELQDAWGQWSDDDLWWSSYRRITHFALHKPFDIRAGETVYLGEVWFDLNYRSEVELRDAQRRDFGHMRRVWKVNDLSSIAIRPLTGKVSGGY
ncbi:hypothetical protein [Pseudogulbenkiania subflava]|uniref:Lipoprotein n=1 Tax=Pseudogulbenkiania subflava DSM 22618 TaxID=1123014 RepID=A0A1Y6BWX5_9NEIS|nr:hypothetical protein [Pseudogulbenkiania subflava]SMF22363.1 hypothetical protein SAMN02745746_01969 [Pseudogulbenkiania subflava DSM 22618]